MKQRPISKDIQPSPENDPASGRLVLKVKVSVKSLLMAPWFFSMFLLLPVVFGGIWLFYPETRFISAILAAVVVVSVLIRIKFSRYRDEDELVVYKDRDDIVVCRKSEYADRFVFNMKDVTRAWIHQDYTNGALMSSYIILFVPEHGENSPKRGLFNDRNFETEKGLPLPRMHPNILAQDDLNLLVLTFIERNYPHIAIGCDRN